MPRPPLTETARAAYEAYGAATGQLTHDDRPLPAWEDLSDRTRAAWTCAAGAVALDTLTHLGASPGGTPDVGDVVLVPVDPADNNGSPVAPALVTRVWNAATVNVRVLLDGDAIRWRTSMAYVDNLDDVQAGAAVWAWTGGN